ncbi:MAG: TPM domain-containing protein [Candidatus Howiella sp.]
MMKKRMSFIITLILALSLCSVTAFAANETSFITDVTDTVSESEISELNNKAMHFYDTYGVGVYFYMTDYTQETDAYELAEASYDKVACSNDGIMLMLTKDEWCVVFFGSAADFFTSADEETLWNAVIEDENETYYDGISDYLITAERMLKEYGYAAAAGNGVIPDARQCPRLTDNADILSDSEETALLAQLDEISERQQFDVAVLTVSSLDDAYTEIGAYADDYYDFGGFGLGENRDGVILVLNMDSRDWYMSTCGYGITAITDAGREYMSEQFLPYLSDGDYAEGFAKYAQLCDEFVTKAKAGSPYDVDNIPKDIDWFNWIGSSLILGIVGAFIFAGRLKSKMKSVAFQSAAGSYIAENSLNVTDSKDVFMYSNVTRSKRETESDGSGGSGGSRTHTSSSGTTHGGGGGKF